jgi:hypothetical protein
MLDFFQKQCEAELTPLVSCYVRQHTECRGRKWDTAIGVTSCLSSG